MAKNSTAQTLTYDEAKAFVRAEDARRLQLTLDRLEERVRAAANNPRNQKIGIAAGAAGLGALAYHLLAS